MKAPKNFYLTVSLPVAHARDYEERASQKGVSINRYIAMLAEEGREAVNRAEKAEKRLAEVESASVTHIKTANRLLGIMFRALRETMPSVRKERFDLLWHELAHAQPGEEYERARDMVAQFVQIPTERPVEAAEPDYMN